MSIKPQIFETHVKVRFAHCDPAGIIFYPRYFEILNGVVEDWFDQFLGYSFNQMLNQFGIGTPMVDLQTKFLRPCRLDDILDMALRVENVGTSSAIIQVSAHIKNQLHIHTRGVLVCSKRDLTSSTQWPKSIAQSMENFIEPSLKA